MYSSCLFTTSALDGGELSASRPGRALPRRKYPPRYPLDRVGPRSGLDTQVRGKILASAGIEPLPDTILTDLPRFPVKIIKRLI
jgi:hypothetical protein